LFSPANDGFYQKVSDHTTPTTGGLPSILTASLIPTFLLPTLTITHRLVAKAPRILGRIVSIIGIVETILTTTLHTIHLESLLTMLTTTRANILKPNLSTTAIAKHFLSPLLLISVFYRSNLECQTEKKWREKYFVAQDLLGAVWYNICSVCHFGRPGGRSAILAVAILAG